MMKMITISRQNKQHKEKVSKWSWAYANLAKLLSKEQAKTQKTFALALQGLIFNKVVLILAFLGR